MENPRKPDRKPILGLTPVAFWCFVPLVTIGVAMIVHWLFNLFVSFFR